MLKRFPIIAMAVLSAGLTASSAFAGAVLVSGPVSGSPVCEYGNCANPDQVGVGGAVYNGFSFDVTTFSGDEYLISGSISATQSSLTTFLADVTAEYIGLTPTTSEDAISIDVLQDYFNSGPGTWAGNYEENVPILISAGVGAGTQVYTQLTYGTQAPTGTSYTVGSQGPFTGPGAYTANETTFLPLGGGNILTADYLFYFDFKPGTVSDAGVAPIPEPAEMLPMAVLAMAGAGYAFLRNRKRAILGSK